MCRIFLHGGGDDVASRRETFGQFVAAMMVGETGKLALVLEEEETAVFESQQAYSTIFTSIGFPADNIAPIYATKTNPLTYEMLVHIAPSGLFVCGGVTPSYQPMVLVNYRPKLAIESETKPVSSGSIPFHCTKILKSAIVHPTRLLKYDQTRCPTFLK